MKAKKNISSFVRKNMILIALILFIVVFQFLTKGIFLGARNLTNLLRQTSIIGVCTMGMLLLMLSGNIDLACGMSVAACGGISAVAMVKWGWTLVPSILIALVLGVLIGLWQGLWISKGGLVPFICTLGDQLLFQGIYLTVIQGKTIGPVSNAYKQLSQGYLGIVLTWIVFAVAALGIVFILLNKRKKARKYGLIVPPLSQTIVRIIAYIAVLLALTWRINQNHGLPVPVLIMFTIVVLTALLLEKTRFGRRVYAIGGNREAAKLSGINISFEIIVLYVIMGLLCALAGVMLVARLDGAVNSAGNAYETDCISACVIGGTSMSGGVGGVFGAILGAFLMSVLENGMGLMGISTYVQYIVKGIVLIIAVWLDISSKKGSQNLRNKKEKKI